jgi:hypothetical protein
MKSNRSGPSGGSLESEAVGLAAVAAETVALECVNVNGSRPCSASEDCGSVNGSEPDSVNGSEPWHCRWFVPGSGSGSCGFGRMILMYGA